MATCFKQCENIYKENYDIYLDLDCTSQLGMKTFIKL